MGTPIELLWYFLALPLGGVGYCVAIVCARILMPGSDPNQDFINMSETADLARKLAATSVRFLELSVNMASAQGPICARNRRQCTSWMVVAMGVGVQGVAQW